jgi:hypothetical protein
MHVRFLSDGSEYRSYGGSGFSKKKESNGSIFWWAILITLLMGAATFCWFFSIMVFAHPEKPFNYKVLAKFNKLEPLRPWSTFSVPNGKKVGARELLSEFYSYSREQLAVKNDMLKRSYIRNYKHEHPLYVTGGYQVVGVRQLGAEDVITSGWVVRVRSAEIEDVDLEILLPGTQGEQEPFNVGDKLVVESSRPQLSVLHVQRLDGERICVTTVPLAYSPFTAGATDLKMAPPDRLNMDAFWPVTRDVPVMASEARVDDGVKDVAAKS